MRALRAFHAASKHLSFRAAADDLFLTASAVSHQIKQLESEMGVRLFDRQPRRLTLTEAGSAFADDLAPILEDLDVVVERHSRQPGEVNLRLSVQPFFASELLMPHLSDFLGDNPGISITVDTTNGAYDWRDTSADVSIRLFSRPPGEASDRLFALRLVPVSSPSFYDTVKVVAGRITSDFPLIVHDARPKAWRLWQKSSGIRLPGNAPEIRLNSMISVARAAELGLGAALMPTQLCHAWFESGALVPIFDHELRSGDGYYLVCGRNGAATKHIEKLRTWVLQKFATER
jgi:LysR family glycine cleavage system transcriptional activator